MSFLRPLSLLSVPLALALFSLPVRADQGWPREITHAAGTLLLEKPPERVVSTAPSLTGILLAIDAPLKATATAMIGPLTDDKGFFNQWAALADSRGVQVLYGNLKLDLEALVVADPDLVVVSATGGDSVLAELAQLQAQGLQVMVVDYSVMSWEEQAVLMGMATGHEQDAAAAIADFDSVVAAAATRFNHPSGTVQIVSYNFGGTYAVSQTYSAQAKVLAALGFEVSPMPEAMAGQASRRGDFDFMSLELLPQALQSESIFLLNGTPAMVEAFMADPVLANVPAVKAGQVYPLGPTSFRVDYYSGLDIVRTLEPLFAK